MIKTWAVTDTGLVRKENQDTYRIARNGDICVVCDGMGGAAGGRLASTLASETYAAEMEKALKPDMTPEQLKQNLPIERLTHDLRLARARAIVADSAKPL